MSMLILRTLKWTTDKNLISCLLPRINYHLIPNDRAVFTYVLVPKIMGGKKAAVLVAHLPRHRWWASGRWLLGGCLVARRTWAATRYHLKPCSSDSSATASVFQSWKTYALQNNATLGKVFLVLYVLHDRARASCMLPEDVLKVFLWWEGEYDFKHCQQKWCRCILLSTHTACSRSVAILSVWSEWRRCLAAPSIWTICLHQQFCAVLCFQNIIIATSNSLPGVELGKGRRR